MLQIYLHGEKEHGFLDINSGTVLDMERLSELFDEDISTGEFSLPVELPWTENNRRLMSFSERIENFNTKVSYWVCDVYSYGFPEMINAKITLLEKSGSFSYIKGKFNASLSGTKGLFGSAIKNKKLRDLKLGGIINWQTLRSREFANYVMRDQFPQYNYIAFAPVAIEGFFDQSKEEEPAEGDPDLRDFLAKDTVNYITPNDGAADSWTFGRPSVADENFAINPGEEGYIDHRTIPFFKFKYVLTKAFEEIGYSVAGEILDNADFNDLFIFNTTAIDFYSFAALDDYNRKINPADHVPDISLLDFFKKVFAFFNVYPVFSGTHVDLLYRKRIFTGRRVLDITDRCDPNFISTYKDATEDSGYKLQYAWDDSDDYRDDRVKDLSTKQLVATVSTVPNLGTLDIGRDFTTDDIVFVESENMYYVCANATVVPVLWDAYSEKLEDYVKGAGGREIDLGIGTLCTYVEYVEDDALYVRRNRVGCRQIGSYWTNKFLQVKTPFSLRLFYIKKQLVAGQNVPVSFNHYKSPAGSIIENYSLALQGPAGIGENFHSTWQDFQEGNQTIKVTVRADKKFMVELEACNTIQIQNILFLVQKIEDNLPLQATIDMYLVPL